MSPLIRFILSFIIFLLDPKCDRCSTAEEVLFWELKPYIWRGNDGNTIGIIPDIFNNAYTYCAQGVERKRLNFTLQFEGYEEFTKTLASNITYGEGILKNVSTKGTPFWLPFLVETEKINQTELKQRNLAMHAISSATSMSVVVPRRRINLPVKLIRGIKACSSIVSIALMLSVFFGALIWILERNHGSAFNDCIFNGLWWSQVTMTTTGYGDFVPVTCLGKTAASTWMFCGVIILAVTTATVSDSVNGISGLEIKEKNVAVLKNSYEELIAYRDFNATIVACNSYEDVFENVKNGKAEAALINTDVLSWNIEKLNDNLSRKNHLSVIQHIPVEFPIAFAGAIINKTSEFFNCIYKNYEKEVLIWTQNYYKKYVGTNTIYIGGIYETLLDDGIFLILTCVSTLLLILCMIREAVKWFKTKNEI